jgi:cytochrome c556
MRHFRYLHAAALLPLLLASACAQEAAMPPTEPVLTLMVDVVTPATNTLWSIEDPQTDADWQTLADAADLTIRAFERIRTGGSGPNDMAWVADPRWQGHSAAAIAAARKVRLAIDRRDSLALGAACEELRPPCEACHVDFHPNLGPEES